MSEKPGFMLYHNDMKALAKMPSKDLGDLIKALYFVSIGEDAPPLKKNEVIFDMMAERIREDSAAYDRKVEQRRRAGQASAEARQRASTDVDNRQHSSTKSTNNNTIQYNNNSIQHNNNAALNYAQRADDMNDVMTEM